MRYDNYLLIRRVALSVFLLLCIGTFLSCGKNEKEILDQKKAILTRHKNSIINNEKALYVNAGYQVKEISVSEGFTILYPYVLFQSRSERYKLLIDPAALNNPTVYINKSWLFGIEVLMPDKVKNLSDVEDYLAVKDVEGGGSLIFPVINKHVVNSKYLRMTVFGENGIIAEPKSDGDLGGLLAGLAGAFFGNADMIGISQEKALERSETQKEIDALKAKNLIWTVSTLNMDKFQEDINKFLDKLDNM